MLRFFLDNTLVINQPFGAKAIKERLFDDETLFCRLSEITGNLIFWEDEYDYIYDSWVINSCSKINITIQKYNVITTVWDLEFNGFIYLSDVIFDDDRRRVECELVDNSFIAMIDNNKSIKMNMNVALSKNEVPITITNTSGIDIFTYSPGGGTYHNRNTISVYNAFKALVAFMTDDTCEFESDFFNDPVGQYTEGNQYFLLTGEAVVAAGLKPLPTISFDELFTDMRRAYNLKIGMEIASNGKPLVRIEPKSYFRSESYYTLTDFKNIKFQRKLSNQYTKISVGNDLSTEVNTFVIFDYIWETYKNKEYFLGGQCNEKDNELDLTLQTVCADVRVIESVQSALVVEDDKIFIIAIAYFGGGANEFWNPLDLYSPSTKYNNKSLTNGRIIDRWEDDIFSSVNLLEFYVNDISVELNTPQVIGAFTDLIFDNDSTGGFYDHGNAYDNTTGIYTCYITGTYRFRFSITLTSVGGTSIFDIGFAAGLAGGPQGLFWYYDGSLISNPQTLLAGETATYDLEYEIPLLEGTDVAGALLEATLSVQVAFLSGAGTLSATYGTFEVFTPASGAFRSFGSNGSYSKEISSIGGIDSNMWSLIKQNRDFKLRIQGVHRIHEGYAAEIERNIEDGKATIKMLGKP